MKQKTVAAPCVLQGVGVHSGVPSVVTVKSAPVDTGIVWRHISSGQELVMGSVVPVAAPHATVLATDKARVSTIEHIMAALWACGITNAVCELQGDEAPIMDGSSLPIIWALEQVGVADQDAPVKYITPREELLFEDAQRNGQIVITPAQTGDNKLYLDYEGVEWVAEQFIRDFASARTCGAVEQLPMLRQHGLARGSTLGNSIATAGGQFLNTPRFDNEPLRHKVLDLIGDLYLLGAPLAGSITACNTGHSFNRQVIAHFVEHPDAWVVQ